MMRRGDGIGIEVLPDVLRGVRLQQEAPGRVAKVAGVSCETNNDLGHAADGSILFDAIATD